jgi:hypothetical protein
VLIRFIAAALLVVTAVACHAHLGPSQGYGRVTYELGGSETELDNATCTWYEGSGQLFVEAGDSEGADYVLLAAPLDWLGEPLPEGPGEPPELSLRSGGVDLVVDHEVLAGTMNAAQTEGTFTAQLSDGTLVNGAWECPEVTEE